MRYSNADRPPPLPEVDREKRTLDLIATNSTDIDRWTNFTSLATQWDARAQRASQLIPDGMRVLDIGCGAMALKTALKSNCVYTGADVVERAPGCQVIDLNKCQFPVGDYDWTTFLGVLEYVHDPAWPLVQAAKISRHLLLTFCVNTKGVDALPLRRGMGWVSDLDLSQIRVLLENCGWKIEVEYIDKVGLHNNQIMFVCYRK